MVDGRTFTTSFVIHIAQHVVPSSFDQGVYIYAVCLGVEKDVLTLQRRFGMLHAIYWLTFTPGNQRKVETRTRRNISPLWGIP